MNWIACCSDKRPPFTFLAWANSLASSINLAAARLIEEASEFAQARKVKGGLLSEQQAIQFMLADSVTELWATRLMLYETAMAHDREDDVKALHYRCSAVKLYASEMANKVADISATLFAISEA